MRCRPSSTGRCSTIFLADSGGHRCYTQPHEDEKKRYYRAQTKWRQPFFATDPMDWWAGPAARMGLELVREYHPSVIFVTMSPFTAAAAGIALKAQTNLPLVLDRAIPWGVG